MQQYFAKQLGNCCKLNFSNKIIKPPKNIITPNRTPAKLKHSTHKSQKKSLKRIHSDYALGVAKQYAKQTDHQAVKNTNQHKEYEFNDYGHRINCDHRTEKKFETKKQLFYSARDQNLKLLKSLQKNLAHPSPNNKTSIEQLGSFRFSDKTIFAESQRIQQPRSSVFVQNTAATQNIRPQYLAPQRVPVYYRQIQSHQIHSSQLRYQNLPISQKNLVYARSPIKNQTIKISYNTPYSDKTSKTLSQTPVLHKNLTNYSQNFKLIYGEVQIQEEIKKDLMKSLQFNRVDSQNQTNFNAVSMLTKYPPSEQSTILPPESKLMKRTQYQTDFSNIERKVCTEEYLKSESQFCLKPQSLRLKGRQKFKSIVSVQSEHSSSSQSVDSIIIDQHPQKMVSSNPIKTLL